MSKVSIIITAYNEPYLNKTIYDILKKAEGAIELIVNIDGDKPKKLVTDKRVKYFHHQKPLGMRGGINIGLNNSTGKYIMKLDAHCLLAKGFDTILKQDCKENWLMIPRRYSLNPKGWKRDLSRPFKDYHYICYPPTHKNHILPVEWHQRTLVRENNLKYEIDETMTFQGSCWFANRKYFMKTVGYLDEDNYKSFGGEQLEIGLKYWLGGGEVKVNKRTWYAHLFKNKHFYKYDKGLLHHKKGLIKQGNYEWIARHWVNNKEQGTVHKFQWLVEKFWPVPGWPEDRNLWNLDNSSQREPQVTKVDSQTNTEVLNTLPYKVTPLCKLAQKYGTDKCPQIKHGYTPFYYKSFKDKAKSIKKVLEMGIGLKNGASLKMWRDFFPNSLIYGADNNPQTLIKSKRIKTYLCDMTSESDIKKLVKQVGSDIDIFIDDGDHIRNHQTFLANTLLPLLNDDVIYIIEDVLYTDYVLSRLKKYHRQLYLAGGRWRDDRLIIVSKKPTDQLAFKI